MFMDNLDRICRERNTSASAVCAEIGKSKNSPSNWRKSGAIPNESDLLKLAQKLNCRVGDFFRQSTIEYCLVPLGDESEKDISAGKLFAAISKGLVIDDNVLDMVRIYDNCQTPKQRTQLMSAVYDFEDKVLNAEEETC